MKFTSPKGLSYIAKGFFTLSLILLGTTSPRLYADEGVVEVAGGTDKALVVPTPEPVKDPRLVAQVMGAIDIDSLTFKGQFYQTSRFSYGGDTSTSSGVVHFKKSIGFTYLTWRNTQTGDEPMIIVDCYDFAGKGRHDPPLDVFPRPFAAAVTVTSFNSWFYGYNDQGQLILRVIMDDLAMPLAPDAVVSFTMSPTEINYSIGFDYTRYSIDDPSQIEMVIKNGDWEQVIPFDLVHNRFNLWIDPTVILTVIVRDRRNHEVIYWQTVINPTRPPPSPNESRGNSFNLHLDAGVQQPEFESSGDGFGWFNLSNESFLDQIDGHPSETYIIKVPKGLDNEPILNAALNIYVYDNSGRGGAPADESETTTVPTPLYRVLIQQGQPASVGPMPVLFDELCNRQFTIENERSYLVLSVINTKDVPSPDDTFSISVSYQTDGTIINGQGGAPAQQ